MCIRDSYYVDCYTVACLLVGLVIALDGKHRVDAVICPALQPQTFARCQAADATLVQNTVTVFCGKCMHGCARLTGAFGVAGEVCLLYTSRCV